MFAVLLLELFLKDLYVCIKYHFTICTYYLFRFYGR
jgi:hypothetical protein